MKGKVAVVLAMLAVTSMAGAWSLNVTSATPGTFGTVDNAPATKYIFNLVTDGETTNAIEFQSAPGIDSVIGNNTGNDGDGFPLPIYNGGDAWDSRMRRAQWSVLASSYEKPLATVADQEVWDNDVWYTIWTAGLGQAFTSGHSMMNLVVKDGSVPVKIGEFRWVPTSGPDSGELMVADVIVNTIPEPTTIGLLAMGVLGLIRRK